MLSASRFRNSFFSNLPDTYDYLNLINLGSRLQKFEFCHRYSTRGKAYIDTFPEKPAYWTADQFIELDAIRSGIKGYGTGVILKLIQASISEDCPGQIYVLATGSYLFYAKMGFIPLLKNKIAGFADNMVQLLLSSGGSGDFPKYKNRNGNDGIDLVLSEEGMQRWLFCEKNQERFTPFRDFSHLKKFMGKGTRDLLEAILEYKDDIMKDPHVAEDLKPLKNISQSEMSYRSVRLG